MNSCKSIWEELDAGAWDRALTDLYGSELTGAIQRVKKVLEGFQTAFADKQEETVVLFSSPGRTEIGGNHTDHQNGKVLCAAVDLDMLCCAAANGLDRIRISSEGFSGVEVDLSHLLPLEEERGTSAALIRGVAAAMIKEGHEIKGFDAYITTDVLPGSGLSSSAAFEVLIGTILNHFYCAEQLDALQIARIGQYAENVYFGKPCGLMDQVACAVGGMVAIDFQKPEQPAVQKIEYPIEAAGYSLCIIDSGSGHADLTEEYASIPREMGAVAAFFGKRVLREVPEKEFYKYLPDVRMRCGDRAVLRALHFYSENSRVEAQVQSLKQGNFTDFLKFVRDSGLSSSLWLQNTWTVQTPSRQPIPMVLALGAQLLEGEGAIRVHGGGFAGTVQAFVPNDRLPQFQREMERLLGSASCRVVGIRQQGCSVIVKK